MLAEPGFFLQSHHFSPKSSSFGLTPNNTFLKLAGLPLQWGLKKSGRQKLEFLGKYSVLSFGIHLPGKGKKTHQEITYPFFTVDFLPSKSQPQTCRADGHILDRQLLDNFKQ